MQKSGMTGKISSGKGSMLHQLQKRKSSFASIEKSPMTFPITKFEDVSAKDRTNDEEIELVVKRQVDKDGETVC